MKHIIYHSLNTCSKKIEFDLTDDQKIINLKFYHGCPGNLLAISKLVDGHNAKEIAQLLIGNKCGFRQTSCADQLAIAINGALYEKN